MQPWGRINYSGGTVDVGESAPWDEWDWLDAESQLGSSTSGIAERIVSIHEQFGQITHDLREIEESVERLKLIIDDELLTDERIRTKPARTFQAKARVVSIRRGQPSKSLRDASEDFLLDR